MTAVGELVLVLGLLVSAHCEMRARDPEVEEEEEEQGGRGPGAGVLPLHPEVMETPLIGGKGNSPVRVGNRCAFVQRRVQMDPGLHGSQDPVIKDQSLCSDGSLSCQRSRLLTLLTHKQKQSVVTSLVWRCCPGHGGPNCEDKVSDHQLDSEGSERTEVLLPEFPAGLQTQRADPNREQNDHQTYVNPLYNPHDPNHDQNATHPEPDPVNALSHHQQLHHHQQEHQTHRKQAPAVDQVSSPYPNIPAVLPVPDMMVLVMSQLQPILEGFNRSLEHLNRQVGVLSQDVAQLKGLQLEVEQREGSEEEKLDQVFVQIGEVRRQVEDQRSNMKNILHSQHAMLHYNLSSFKVDVDAKLKRHQKLLQVSLQAMNTTLAELKLDQDLFSNQKPENELPPTSLLPLHPPSDTAALWEAITRLDNMVVNNTVKVGGLMEDVEVTSGSVKQLTQHLKVLEKQINQTARTSQVLFMETGLEVEQAKVLVQQQVEELAGNVTQHKQQVEELEGNVMQHEQRLQQMDTDVDYLFNVIYNKNLSLNYDCEDLKAAVAHLQRGVANVTELANENRLALEENSEVGGVQWGGASDWDPVVVALQQSLQQVQESLVLEQNRTRTLDLDLTQLNASFSGLQATDKRQEVQVKLLSASFRALLEDVIRHSEVLQLLLGEEVLEFLEWPLQDQEAHSIPVLKEQFRELQEQLRSLKEASDRETGGREEVPSADQPSSSSLPHWLPGGSRRGSGGASGQNQLLLLHPEMRLHAGDGSDLWNLEKKVEELQQRLVHLEEKPCSCNNTPAGREAPPAGVEVQLQEEVMWLKRGLEEHLRIFKNVFSNADVLVASDETLELDKLWELMKRRSKKRGGKGDGRSCSRREETADQSHGSLLFVGGSPQSTSNNVIVFQPSLNQGQFYSNVGVFTAPVDGIYLFILTLDLRPGPAHVLLRRGQGWGGASMFMLHEVVKEAGPVSDVGLMMLREGEEVRLEVRRGEWAESEDNMFKGLLLHRTT